MDARPRAVFVSMYACKYPVSASNLSRIIGVIDAKTIREKIIPFLFDEGLISEEIQIFSNQQKHRKRYGENVNRLYKVINEEMAREQAYFMSIDTQEHKRLEGKKNRNSRLVWKLGRRLYDRLKRKGVMHEEIVKQIEAYSQGRKAKS